MGIYTLDEGLELMHALCSLGGRPAIASARRQLAATSVATAARCLPSLPSSHPASSTILQIKLQNL